MLFLGDWAPGSLACNVRVRSACALVNLEGPILRAGHEITPVPKAGPRLYSTSLPDLRGRLVTTLANNHTMDFGVPGLDATLQVCAAGGVAMVGAGSNLAVARQPVYFTDGDVRLAVIGCCEAQFGSAERDRAGVAVLGPWVTRCIRRCAAQTDVVVVSVHAAAEMSPWPSPTMQDLYRSWVEAGASVVHGHHAHVPQGIEEYEQGLILYGLGNFAIDPELWSEYPDARWSLAVEVDLCRSPPAYKVDALTCRLDDDQIVVEPLDVQEFGAYLAQCNRPLTDRALLEGLWQETSVRAYREYYREWLGFPDAVVQSQQHPRGLLRRMMAQLRPSAEPSRATRGQMQLWYHLFACQSHCDQIATALGVLSHSLPDRRNQETTALVDALMPWTRDYADPTEADLAVY